MTERVAVRRLVRGIDERAGSGWSEFPLLSVSQTRGVVPRSEIDEAAPRAADLSIYKLCRPRDVILNRMSAYRGAVGLATIAGLVSPDYLVLRPTRLAESRYLTYLIKSPWFVDEMAARVRGIGSIESGVVRTPRIGERELGDICVAIPARHVQVAVADYLDRETAEIDAFIADQEELIALLEERRCATLDRAIPGRTRAAADEVIGVRFSRVVRITSGQVDPELEPHASMPLIAPNHIESRTGRLITSETAAEQGAESGKYRVRKGQVIYSKIRPALAKATMAPFDCLCSADMYALDSREPSLLDNCFLWYSLLTSVFTEWAINESARVAMPKLNQETLATATLKIPSIDDQRAICAQLASELPVIDATIADAREAIALSKERRAALISAAVTGQIDVTEKKRVLV